MNNPLTSIIERLDGIDKKLSKINTGPHRSSFEDEIISRQELAKRLSLTEITIYTWTKKNKLPFLRIGQTYRYNWQKVLAAIENKK